ncbi:MAG: aminoacyl-tRNA hydrolase [Opitutales bacterium]|nr:aminoacyl-tRNA hydrolase [Opitutales bacterium]
MNRKLIVGIGNPGEEYAATRHNVGARVVDRFCLLLHGTWKKEKKLSSTLCVINQLGYTLILAKPDVYVNESGSAVQKICQFYKIPIEDVIIIYDDVAFDVGDFRLSIQSGTGGHNGVADILSHIGPGFVRFRVGVGPKHFLDLKDHVLGRFTEAEEGILAHILPEILCDLQLLLDKGPEYSMNLTNRKKNYEQQEKLQG